MMDVGDRSGGWVCHVGQICEYNFFYNLPSEKCRGVGGGGCLITVHKVNMLYMGIFLKMGDFAGGCLIFG
jgi:hypothetical protein